MVKVEMLKDAETGITKLAFETNDVEGQEIIDNIRVAMLGDHPKQGGYVNGNRLVIEVKTNL